MKGILIGGASALLSIALFVYQWPFSRVELALYDHALRWFRTMESPPDEIVLAAIDERSMETLGDWPWPRALHARAIDRLASDGARAIYLDVGIFDPDVNNPASDQRLVDATAEAGNVVYPMAFDQIEEDGKTRIAPLEPLPELQAAAAVAHAHLGFGSDDVVRWVHLAYRTEERTYWGPSVELLRLYLGLSHDEIQPYGPRLVRLGEINIPVHEDALRTPPPEGMPRAEYELNISFFGESGTFRRTSAVDVIESRFPQGSFDGRIVIYGMATGLDGHATSMSSEEPMAGIELQANAVATILKQRFVRRASTADIVAATLLFSLGMGWIGARRRSPYSPLLLAALAVSAVLALFFLLIALGYWIPIAPVISGLVLACLGTKLGS